MELSTTERPPAVRPLDNFLAFFGPQGLLSNLEKLLPASVLNQPSQVRITLENRQAGGG
jgi:hypothetical protein